MRGLRILLALLVGGGALAACGKRTDQEREALTAVRASANLPRKFLYREQSAGLRLDVAGLVQDDFSYRARLKLNGRDYLDQVVYDDAIALRILASDRLPPSDPAASADAAMTPERAIRTRRWVVDESGAPPLRAGAAKQGGPIGGRDPVTEAFRILSYAETALLAGDLVARYDEESLYYRPSEDPFPLPKPDSGVRRYDVVRPRVPRQSDQQASRGSGAGAGQNLPGEAHYRKFSVYVRDGRVFRVLERVAFDERLDDTVRFLRVGLDRPGTAQSVKDDFDEAVESLRGERLEQAVLAALNVARKAVGQDPIRLRTVSVDFTDLGGTNAVALPGDGVPGDLAAFFPEQKDDAGGAAAAGG